MSSADNSHFDVIVVGLGAMGSATLYQAAKRGARVLGIDKYTPPHDRASSHGDTRLTRLAIGEGRHYVPYAMRSHEIWRELEAATGEDILTVTGGLFFCGEEQGSPVHGASDFIGETVASAEAYGIEHEVLDSAELGKRFPQFKLNGIERGYYEPEAGFVRPEKAIEVQLAEAQKRDATVLNNTEVLSIEATSPTSAVVKTADATYTADKVVVSTGAWISKFFGPLFPNVFEVYRQCLFWVDTEIPIENFLPDRFPVYIRTDKIRDDVLYGFPSVDGPEGGIKIASEYYGETCDPDEGLYPVTPEETEEMLALASRFLKIGTNCYRASPCLFTVTPDGEFVMDEHPEHPALIFASPCSGHGFKHSSAIGERLATMALGSECDLDLSHFRLARFS